MAAPMTDQHKTCTICFELREVLKIIGPCKHHFCPFCLSSHFERQRQRGDALSCPTCHTDCYLPDGGVDQLTDLSWDAETDNAKMADPKPDEVQEGGAVSGDRPKTDLNPYVFQVNCQICHHRGKEVQAANLCLECNHLYICEGCTVTHATNKATKAHVVIPLKTKCSEEANEEICAKHRSSLTIYCCTCKEPACKICVQIDHGDHEVQQLSDLIHAKVEEVKVIFSKREQELKGMKILKAELMALRSAATSLDKQDNLIKEIEDHTEKCIKKLIKLKEELKADVRKKFAALKEATADLDVKLEMVNESIKKLNSSLEQKTKLLSETKFQTSYLDQVTSLKTDLKAVTTCDTADGKKFHDSIHKLQQSSTSFIPEEPSTIGSLQVVLSADELEPELIATHTMETDSTDKFIPCLGNLGDKFAVAHPTKKGQPSDGVNIYEFPNSLKLTLTGDVGPVHDLASTPYGQLAVLSDGSTGTSSCSIKMFDPNTGKNIITHNLDIAKAMSLGVNFQNQYVILSGKKQGKAQITVVNDDGSVELEQVINVPVMSIKNPGRITCGWRYIYILVPGQRKVRVYEVKGNKLVQIATDLTRMVLLDNAKDISASVWDHLFLADQVPSCKDIYMNRFIQETNSTDWDIKHKHVHTVNSQADEEFRISARGSYTIMSWGQTFAVFQ